MVNLSTNTNTVDVSITQSYKAWAFPTRYDLTEYLRCVIDGVTYLNKIEVTFTVTDTLPMQYVVILSKYRFAYRIPNTPINHPTYGIISAWGMWVPHPSK